MGVIKDLMKKQKQDYLMLGFITLQPQHLAVNVMNFCNLQKRANRLYMCRGNIISAQSQRMVYDIPIVHWYFNQVLV